MYTGPVAGDVTTVSPDTPADVHIRPAVRPDLLAVHRIEQAAFPQPWPFAAFEEFLDRPGFLVAEDSTVVGYVVADTVETGARELGHIKDIAVRADRRREGIASALLARATATLETETTGVKLEVRAGNEGAIDLYRRHGFSYRRRLPGYYANGEDGLVMVRSL